MAYEIPGFSFTLPAGADFSAANQFRFVAVSTLGKAINPTANGNVVGVRQTRPKLNEATTIVASGISIVEAGGVINIADKVATNGTGQAVAAAGATTAVQGIALEGATGAGIQIAVLLIPNTVAAS